MTTNQIANGSNCTHMLSPFMLASINWSLGRATRLDTSAENFHGVYPSRLDGDTLRIFNSENY